MRRSRSALSLLLAMSCSSAALADSLGGRESQMRVVARGSSVDAEREEPDPLSERLTSTAGSFTHVVPIVLTVKGVGEALFSSELTFTNRAGSDVGMLLTYTAAFGTGSGTVPDRVAARTQRTVPDAITYLRDLGLAIPTGVNVGGTLRVEFSGLSAPTDAAVSVRTTVPVPDGRAGLAYAGVVAGLPQEVYVCGLRQNATDRSNLALVNLGGPGSESVRLTVTVYPMTPLAGAPKVLAPVTLPPGGFRQLDGVLALAGYTSGWVRIDASPGPGAYYAYGVINDQGSADGSFVMPSSSLETISSRRLVLPVVVESGPFSSELVLTNTASYEKTVRVTLVADGIATPDRSVSVLVHLAGETQLTVGDVVDWLRGGTTGLPPRGTGVAGALFITGTSAGSDVPPSFVVASCRTSSPGAVGRYGLFYGAVGDGNALEDAAWIHGLRQDAENRTNLALVNTAERDPSGTDTFSIDVFDGETGDLTVTLPPVDVAPRGWVQLPMVLGQVPGTPSNAYVKVRRTSGTNPFIAYAVVNDGAAPGLRSGDGAYLAAEPDCRYHSTEGALSPGRSGGRYLASIPIQTNCPWTIATTEGWITFPSYAQSSGKGPANFGIDVARNETGTPRSGVVQVGGAALQVVQGANAPSVYDGTWSGTTGQGKPISFRVEKGEIVSLTLGMAITVSCGSAVATYTEPFSSPQGVHPGAFDIRTELTSAGSGSPFTTIWGAFTSTNRANGSFTVSEIVTNGSRCMILGEKPGFTWTATKP